MKQIVSKLELITSLEKTIRLTGRGVDKLELSKDEESVFIFFDNGQKIVANIAADSHIAIVRDVCKYIN